MPSMKAGTNEMAVLRGLLARSGGRVSWQALEEVAGTPEFRAFLEARHPSLGPLLAGPGRRRILQIMAASFAFGGLSSAARAQSSGYDQMVPYVTQPRGVTPTVPMSYASATLLDGIANGVLVTTMDGRPIKIEGNPDHPWSRGGTDLFAQASVLDLYDPDRSQAVQRQDGIAGWDSFQGAMLGRFAALRADRGRGLRLLTGPISSPSLIAQIQALQKLMPEMHWHTHAPVGRDAIYAGARQAFGKPLETGWDFSKADHVVSLDGDFLDAGPQQAGAARQWSDARRDAAKAGRLLTMHAVAPTPTLTSTKADHHRPIAPHDLVPLAEALLADVSGGGGGSDGPLPDWRGTVASALRGARGRSIVLTGAWQSPELHEAVHRINAALGNTGTTVLHTDPVLAQAEPLHELVVAMQHGDVQVLVMLDTNPAYSAPADADFAASLGSVPLKLHAGLHVDETGVLADWHLPLSHPLESWGDARSLDGTVTLIQPTIQRLYDTRTVSEILSLLLDPQPRNAHELLQAFWQAQAGGTDFAAAWHRMLLAGFVADSALPAQDVSATAPAAAGQSAAAAQPAAATGPDLVFRPDPTIWDGAFANNGWLQELPKPMTKTVWQNVVAVSPKLAAQHGLQDGDMVAIGVGERSVSGPIWIQAGQDDGAIVLQLGYGRRHVGGVGDGIGYDAYQVRLRDAPWRIGDVSLRRVEGHEAIATTQQLDRQEGHDYVRRQAIGATPVGDQNAAHQATLYTRTAEDGRAWGMVIDLDTCIGCNACVVACQAENNVPVVGKDQVLAGRDMHWLRVDRYYSGADENPRADFMPVPCMNCETAPCELGCPVEATLHDSEGLNLMVYNRCIGTRACSAYCPYKVRHFNFLHYSEAPASIQAQRNPDVTVRARGVMEKCTYCVQRIVAARIEADTQHRPIRDGEVVTACAAACPTRAISFGDLADKASAVAAARQDPRNYALLGELNTRPRTTYLAALAPADGKA